MKMSDEISSASFPRRAILGYIASRTGNVAVAEDLTHDVFVKATRSAPSQGSGRYEAWLFTIARNTVADYFRHAKNTEHFEEGKHAIVQGGNAMLDEEEQRLREVLSKYVRGVVDSLPIIYRDALRATEYEGVSQVELAHRLGLSVSGAKSRVQRARGMVKATIEQCCHWQIDRYGSVVDVQRRTSTDPAACDSCEES